MPEASEKAHRGHPDFRVHGTIFATLGYPDNAWGMVRLAPEEQQELVHEHPGIFQPVKGAWGRQGCTLVRLDAVDDETLGQAMTLAWGNITRRKPARRPGPGPLL